MATKVYVLDRREDDGSVVDLIKIKRLHLGLNKMIEVHGLHYHIPVEVVVKYMHMPKAELQIRIDGKTLTILTTREHTDAKTLYEHMLESDSLRAPVGRDKVTETNVHQSQISDQIHIPRGHTLPWWSLIILWTISTACGALLYRIIQ